MQYLRDLARAAWSKTKPWVVPLTRTFLAGFGTALAAGAADVTSVPTLVAVASGAVVAGVNAVVLLVQRALPGVPDPQPPAG